MSLIKERLFKLRNEPRALQRFVLRRYLFNILEWMGVHVVADHFYEPIPNLKWVNEHYDDSQPFFPAETDWNFPEMEQRVLGSMQKYGGEFYTEVEKYGFRKNHYFQGWDALSLYTYIRRNDIRTVVEIGQGFSTLVSQAALGKSRADKGVDTRFISIDPYARIESQQSTADRAQITTIRKSVQDVGAAEILKELGPNCLLFVDSSHIYKTGSDVEFLMKEIYPKLPSGCHLHVHDIYSPYPWPKAFYTERKWFWNEQEMLEHFLAFNSQFKLTLAAHWLFKDSKKLSEEIPKLGPKLFRDGASIYFQKA
jgi:hypothetical protein